MASVMSCNRSSPCCGFKSMDMPASLLTRHCACPAGLSCRPVAALEQIVQQTRRLRLAAFRPAGRGGRVPAIDIEMRPGARALDKPAQEESRGDRTREGS